MTAGLLQGGDPPPKPPTPHENPRPKWSGVFRCPKSCCRQAAPADKQQKQKTSGPPRALPDALGFVNLPKKVSQNASFAGSPNSCCRVFSPEGFHFLAAKHGAPWLRLHEKLGKALQVSETYTLVSQNPCLEGVFEDYVW